MAIQTYVSSVSVDLVTGQPIVVLKGVNDDRSIPIRVGAHEARAIDLSYRRSRFAVADGHDLLLKFIEETQGNVTAVALEEMEPGKMIAYFRVENNGKPIVIDCRPSDAIAIAVKTGNAIWLSASGLDELNVRHEVCDQEAFKNFLSDLKPSDFRLE